MDLRTKAFLIIGLTLICGILLIMLFSFSLLNESYTRFEEDDVTQKVIQAQKVLEYEKAQILSLTGDWSRWDESYNFVLDRNEDYIIRNLNYASVENLGIDFALFLKDNSSVKYGTQVNKTTESMEQLSNETIAQILGIPGFFSFDSILDGHSGMIIFPKGPALVTSEPIITSTYQGPAAGILVFGMYLYEEKIQQLSEISDLSIQVTPVSSQNIEPSDYPSVQTKKNIYVNPISEDLIQGFTYLPTLDSQGYLELLVSSPRNIVKQGKETIFAYIIILMGLGLSIIFVSLLTVDQLVLKRLHTLIENIKSRNLKRENLSDILLDGNDEFSDLAKEIHPVFMELGRSRRELEEHVRLLTESEKKYRELADLLPEFVFESDLDGNISFMNQMGMSISGLNQNVHLSDLHILRIIDEADHSRFRSALEKIKTGIPISGVEYTGVKNTGERFPLIMYASPIRSGSVITGLRGFAIDISERKEIETSLRKLANIVEHTSTGIVTGRSHEVDYVNSAYSIMHGMEPSDLLRKNPFIVVTGYPEKQFTPYLESALHSGHATFELDHIRKDGTRFPVLHDLTILSGESSENAIWSLNVQNITEQRLAWKALVESEALRESARQLRDVISRLPDATFVIDKDGWVIFWNQAMEALTGISESDIIGRGRYEYAIPFYAEKRPMLLNAVLNKEGTLMEHFPDASKSGDSLFIEESFPQMGKGGKFFSSMAGPLYDSRKNVIGAIQSMRDITPRIMAEKALMRTNEKLNLLSSITRHDIRNRVSVILGLIPLLKGDEKDPETLEIISIVESAAKLIHDQIEFTRVYQNLGVHSPEWKDVGDLVFKVTDVGIPERIQIENNLSGLFVYADPLLERVFYNLVDNAIRHGGTDLSVIRFYWQHRDTSICIYCQDDGLGIPGDLKEKIFERGYGSNTGLGLFLVREILSITGITIVETGLEGKGARFEVVVPYGGYSVKNRKEE
ncbi:PAS domain S-box protein [Methanospirillum sp. J.3.6.1-F.2.7.3]|uniref:histidine kinase n=1 Tax=Methanospirillum purgamenti TaxID=2834276 RepID=A0A8E7B4L7_9EURY|nr:MULTISPECIES: PAS domain S-box protein [Methanospirillum]MDX8550186.1 PAS domain S-box protein [Methanospirillum hungatei]QVV90423.1 PAS domain S-box protein [Methanospirillum sp. J.3.6.1-F.2.7.3]